MKVRVKLYGTLNRHVPGYQPSQGIEVEIPDGATVQDLLTHLGIPASQRTVVIVKGHMLTADDEVRDGVPVNVM